MRGCECVQPGGCGRTNRLRGDAIGRDKARFWLMAVLVFVCAILRLEAWMAATKE